MKSKMNFLSTGASLALLLGIFSIPLLAQHSHKANMDAGKENNVIRVGKKGAVVLKTPLRAGETVLISGNYVFQHKVDGEDHVLIFHRSGKEVARIKCSLEPLGQKKAKRTALYTHSGDGGERILDAIAVEGENVRHMI